MNNQIIYLNPGIKQLGIILAKLRVKKVFLVHGKNSFSLIALVIQKELDKYSTFYFNDFKVNPVIEDVYKGIKEYKKFKPDIIIAVGGGSVIDMAKLIKTLAPQRNKIEDILEDNRKMTKISSGPFIVMPTTAGTGSESTDFSVIYYKKYKYSISSSYMLPNYVILDVELIKSMPPYITFCSLFDALSQATESYWSKFSNKVSKKYAEESIDLILKNFDGYISNPNYENQSNIIKGSNLAGKAINITKTTAPHALSYVFTSFFGIPHGHAVSILLPETIKLSFNKMSEKEKESLDKIFRLFKSKNIDEFCKTWKSLMKKCHLTTRARGFGIRYSDIDFISSQVNLERLKGHPVKLDDSEIKEIIKAII